MSKSTIKIDGYDVPWSFWHKVKKVCAGDEMRAIDAFWRCHKAIERANDEHRPVGEEPFVRYISKGLKKMDGGIPYILLPSPEMSSPQGKARIMAWWKSNYRSDKRKPMTPAGAALKGLLQEIIKEL